MLVSFALGLTTMLTPVPDAGAGMQRREQQEAWRATREGRILPIREIEGRVLPTMRGSQYLGFEFEPGTAIYTLKFLRNGNVIWIEVDGRTGQIVGRTGN